MQRGYELTQQSAKSELVNRAQLAQKSSLVIRRILKTQQSEKDREMQSVLH